MKLEALEEEQYFRFWNQSIFRLPNLGFFLIVLVTEKISSKDYHICTT